MGVMLPYIDPFRLSFISTLEVIAPKMNRESERNSSYNIRLDQIHTDTNIHGCGFQNFEIEHIM